MGGRKEGRDGRRTREKEELRERGREGKRRRIEREVVNTRENKIKRKTQS
jgi:hypothetical protein